MARAVIVADGAPAVAPDFVGQRYIDSASGARYTALGTAGAGDWDEDGAGGGTAAAVQALGAVPIGVVDAEVAAHYTMQEAAAPLGAPTLIDCAHDGAGFVAAAADGTIVKSLDGVTWAPGGAGPVSVRRLRAAGGSVYALDDLNQLWRSDDTGDSWTALGTDITDFLLDVVHTGSQWVGVGRSSDFFPRAWTSADGATWTAAGGTLGGSPIQKVAYDAVNGDVIAAADAGGVLRSTDGGATFAAATATAAAGDPTALAAAGGLAVLTTADGEIAVSTDGGDNWSNPAGVHGVYNPFGLAGGDDAVYLCAATMDDGRFATLRSTDGATWSPAGGSLVPWTGGSPGPAGETLIVGDGGLIAHRTAATGGFALRHIAASAVDIKQPSQDLAYRVMVWAEVPTSGFLMPWVRDGALSYLADVEPAGGQSRMALQASYFGGLWVLWLHPVAPAPF